MPEPEGPDLQIRSGSHIGVIGGGPAGSFFSYFLLKILHRLGIEVQLDIYEPRNFSDAAPGGCNMCGGVVSESLVQNLAAEGINLPPTVVQRGIDSYLLHLDVGSVRIETPFHQKRIAAVYRGGGPRGRTQLWWHSFDEHLLKLAQSQGARWIRTRVDALDWREGYPRIGVAGHEPQVYDLVAVATGVNTSLAKLSETVPRYRPPHTTKTYIAELPLGRERVTQYFGASMHVFLLNIPRLEFAALIPKGDYVTLCLLGQEIGPPLIQSFMNAPEVRQCLPGDWKMSADYCHCSPKINIRGAGEPFADRIFFVGDCGVSRLYKDGIGAAYRCAKAAAITTAFHGISAKDFRRHYWPACRKLAYDNRIGKLIFLVTRQIQEWRFLRRGLLHMLLSEQKNEGICRAMSTIMWDTFTGSAPYWEVLKHSLQPAFIVRFLWAITAGFLARKCPPARPDQGEIPWKQAS